MIFSLICITMVSCSVINSWFPSYDYVSDELKRFADFHIRNA